MDVSVIELRDRTLAHLEDLGWSRAARRIRYPNGYEDLVYQYGGGTPHTLERRYEFGSYGATVRGRAILDSFVVEVIAHRAVAGRNRADRIGQVWVAPSSSLEVRFYPDDPDVPHPHVKEDECCMGLNAVSLPEDLEMAAVALASAITRAIEVVDLSSPLNREWGICRECGSEGLIYSEHCNTCDLRYCRECYESHGCENEPEPDDEDADAEDRGTEIAVGPGLRESLPAWPRGHADAAARLRDPSDATTTVIGDCVLVGCGVTGSWVAPILMRAARRLTVIDPDALDGSSPHGFWTARQGPKVQAMPFGTYAVQALGMRYQGQQAAADLFVLCPDSAEARLAFDDNEAEVRQMLDIRATPSALVVWAVSDGSNDSAWRAWRRSLNGYDAPQACHHDNVPIKAGALAAAFVAWWATSGRPDGLWSIPYGYEGMQFGPSAGEEVSG